VMGRKGFQGKWFYNFSLDQRVPENHILRLVSNAIDFSFVRGLVQHTCSHTGAPSVDPVVIFKMGFLGYLCGISSERQLAEDIRLNLAYKWFLGYDLDETPPDHSILSKARARYGPQEYRQFFSEVVRRCREASLIDGDRVYLDATLVRANASLDSLVSRPLDQQLGNVNEYVNRLWAENPPEDGGETEPPEAPRPAGGSKPGKPGANARRVSRTGPASSNHRRQ